jgi:sarcosine oxidase subunit gamma
MADNTMTTSPGAAVLDEAVLAHRRSPAQHLADEMARGSGEAVSLREVPFLTQTALRALPGSAAAQALAGALGGSLGESLGVALPERAGSVGGSADGSGTAVLWLAPDEFLAVGPDEAVSGVGASGAARRLAEALGGEPGQVVDVSANRTTLELTGPRARAVLEKSCELDLHPREFPVGHAVVTLLESIGVVLWRSGEDTWRVMPRASYSTHVVRWLLDGMREYV